MTTSVHLTDEQYAEIMAAVEASKAKRIAAIPTSPTGRPLSDEEVDGIGAAMVARKIKDAPHQPTNLEPQTVTLSGEQYTMVCQRVAEWEQVFRLLAESNIPSGHELMSLPERVKILLKTISK